MRGGRRRVAAAAKIRRQARDVAGGLANFSHIEGIGAHVFGHNLAARQALNRGAHGPHQGRCFVGFGIADDDRLAAAQG